jgi:hypothetical protein
MTSSAAFREAKWPWADSAAALFGNTVERSGEKLAAIREVMRDHYTPGTKHLLYNESQWRGVVSA